MAFTNVSTVSNMNVSTVSNKVERSDHNPSFSNNMNKFRTFAQASKSSGDTTPESSGDTTLEPSGDTTPEPSGNTTTNSTEIPKLPEVREIKFPALLTEKEITQHVEKGLAGISIPRDPGTRVEVGVAVTPTSTEIGGTNSSNGSQLIAELIIRNKKFAVSFSASGNTVTSGDTTVREATLGIATSVQLGGSGASEKTQFTLDVLAALEKSNANKEEQVSKMLGSEASSGLQKISAVRSLYNDLNSNTATALVLIAAANDGKIPQDALALISLKLGDKLGETANVVNSLLQDDNSLTSNQKNAAMQMFARTPIASLIYSENKISGVVSTGLANSDPGSIADGVIEKFCGRANIKLPKNQK